MSSGNPPTPSHGGRGSRSRGRSDAGSNVIPTSPTMGFVAFSGGTGGSGTEAGIFPTSTNVFNLNEAQIEDLESPTPPAPVPPVLVPPVPVAPSEQGNLRKVTSKTLELHYERLFQGTGVDQVYLGKVRCLYCKQVYVHPTGCGTGTLNRHTKSKHPDKLGISSDQSQIHFAAGAGSSRSDQLFHFNQGNYREGLAEIVSSMNMSFNVGERAEFVQFLQNTLNPAVNPISRRTLTREVHKAYKKDTDGDALGNND